MTYNYNSVEAIYSIPIFQSYFVSKPFFTICIPTYKRSKLLIETLNSCVNQNVDFEYEILVVDNNPERNCSTELAMNNYKKVNISYYKNSQNLGPVGNWNKLFQLAKGFYVIMLHDDDLLEHDYLSKLQLILNQTQKNEDAVYFQYRKIGIEDKISERPRFKNFHILNLKPYDFLFGNNVSIVGACFKKSTVVEINGFTDLFYPSIDYDLHVRLSLKGNSILVIGYPLTQYRIFDNDSRNTETILQCFISDQRIRENLFRNYPKSLYKIISSFLKIYQHKNLIGTVNNFKNNDSVIIEKIKINKECITIYDKIIYNIVWFGYRLLNHIRKYKLKWTSIDKNEFRTR